MDKGELENLWRNLGLEELRIALKKIEDFSRKFEGALQALPECDQCARVSLLEQIQASGEILGGEVVNIVALAGTLKQAVSVAEKAQNHLVESCPPACRCSGGACTCHSLRAQGSDG